MEKKLMLEAINKGEIIEFLEGKGHYKVNDIQWINVSVPTDWTRIINGVYAVYNENPALKVNEIIEDALMDMMDREPFDIYVALSMVFTQLIREQRGASPFTIDKEKILPKLRKALKDNEEKLKNYFEWEGFAYEEGMWGNVVRIDSICRNEWNISIL